MLIKKESQEKKLSNNILSLSLEAAKAKEDNPDVINATIGMFNDESDSFYTFKTINEVLKSISTYEAFSYADTDGGVEFQNAALKWVFDEYLDVFMEKYYVGVVSTPGGSGAIATTFQNYLSENNRVLVPDVMWETYITLAKERNADVLKYQLYDSEGKFNLNSIKEAIESLIDTQSTIILVLNDPCHNPTGFCMEESDYKDLVDLLNSYRHPILLLMDIAYFDFYDTNPNVIRQRFTLLTKLNDNIAINFAFSGSKTFGLYGLRIGANILFSTDSKEIETFKNAITYTSRNNWGSSSRLGLSVITKLVSNEEYYRSFKEEIKEVSLILHERSTAFFDEAKKHNLMTLPYKKGFFVCVPAKDPVALMNKLHEYDVYVVVTKTCIRVALCSISVNEAKQLPKIILKAQKELER